MREEGGIGEMERAGGAVTHNVLIPRDEGELGAVTVMALVFAGPLAEIGGGAGGSGGSLVHAGQSWGIVC